MSAIQINEVLLYKRSFEMLKTFFRINKIPTMLLVISNVKNKAVKTKSFMWTGTGLKNSVSGFLVNARASIENAVRSAFRTTVAGRGISILLMV